MNRQQLRTLLDHVLEDGVRGEPIAKLLHPAKEDYFVLKAKHSGFYDTQLDLLIDYLHVKTVILGGFATDMCVLFTASDAYLRDIEIVVPPDCCAAATMEHHNQALHHMSRVLHVKTPSSIEINLDDLVDRARQPQPAPDARRSRPLSRAR